MRPAVRVSRRPLLQGRLRLLSAVLGAMLCSGMVAASEPALFLRINEQTIDPGLQLQPIDDARLQVTTRLEKGRYALRVADLDNRCGNRFGPKDDTPLAFGKPSAADACAEPARSFALEVFVAGDYQFTLDISDPQAPTLRVARYLKPVKVVREPPAVDCASWSGGSVTVNVGKAWANGSVLRDAYSGRTATVRNGKISLTPAEGSEGILLLEAVKPLAGTAPFSWDAATVYFMLTDRFANGDPGNDHSFGRKKDGKNEIGTWHGGDFKGMTEKLDYIRSLGANAIWITPMVEQVHGFIAGGEKGSFPFYAYHGYWALDFTRIDPNYGDETALQTLIDEAHKRGIRVLLDVVMNHAGYATLADLQDLGLPGLVQDAEQLPPRWSDWQPAKGGNWRDYNRHILGQSPAWQQWWGPEWVRANLPGFQAPGGDDVTGSLAGLPDFLTESPKPVGLPPFLQHKADTRARPLANATVTDYLIQWHTDWVRRFGIDGFRADTVKHLEPAVWGRLKTAASAALEDWKAANPSRKLDDLPFFMVGEVWFHGVDKDHWYANGFDSLLNFDYQREALTHAQCLKTAEPVFAKYASKLNKDPGFNVLSYISSHDTKLFFGDYEDMALQKRVANSFMLLPGGIQLYYGDESGRTLTADDGVMDASLRSDMNWQDLQKPAHAALLAHWQKLGAFRAAHPAIATGSHQKISDQPYAFVREKGADKVMVVFAGRQP